MTEADIEMLSEDHIETIRSSLTMHRSLGEYACDYRYLDAAIRLLAMCSDAKAEEQVRTLLKMAPQNGLPESLVNQANALLQHLQQREENLQLQRSLLRSSSGDPAPAVLLRPAEQNAEAQAKQLVRPGGVRLPSELTALAGFV